MAYPLPKQDYSWTEYLALEAQGTERYEYHDGAVVAMSGGTNRHNKLAGRAYARLLAAADRHGCDAYIEGIKLFRPKSDRYLYPDVMVTCAPLDLQTKSGVRSPLLVIEVLSQGTAHRDFGFKMKEYLRLPTLQHYLILSQEMCLVHHYQRRQGASWNFLLYSDPEETILVPELEASLRLGELYRGIELGPETNTAEEAAAPYPQEED